MKIDRTLFWFAAGKENFTYLEERYFGLSLLLNRLLNFTYDGKKIKFINLYFYSDETYDLHNHIYKNMTHFYNGHLKFWGGMDFNLFNCLTKKEQDNYIWSLAHDYLNKSAVFIKNKDLSIACDDAYIVGLNSNLVTDFQVVQKSIILGCDIIYLCICIYFKEDGMYSKLVVRKNHQIIFEKNIDKTNNGVEFFLDMYKSLELENDVVVIKGRKDVKYLPLRIDISKVLK